MAGIIGRIRTLVRGLYKLDPDWPWSDHIEGVVRYSLILAGQLNADKEIVEIAALLHDIEKIRGNRELHHVRGAEEAGKILKDMDFAEKKTEQVKECIVSHSSDRKHPPRTIEAKIVRDADALSQFDIILARAQSIFRDGSVGKEPAVREKLLKKCEKCWDKMALEESKALAKAKYDAIRLLLEIPL